MAATAQVSGLSARSASRAVRLTGFGCLILLLLAGTLGYLHFFDQEHTLVHNDLLGRQFATRAMLLRGADPYSPEMRHEIQEVTGHDRGQGFDYPVLLGVLLVPVAYVPWETLRLAFLLVMVPALCGSFLLCIRFTGLRVTRDRAAALALLAVCSWPTMFALRLQQPTLLVAALVLPACFLLSRGQEVGAAILLALSTFKPQLVLPLLLWLLVWSCVQRRWKLPVAFTITEAAYFLCSERLAPGWVLHWLADLHRYRSLAADLPLQLIFGHWLGLACTVGLAAWTLWHLWRLRRCSAESAGFGKAIGLLLPLSICLTPITWAMIYDQILLVPAVFLLLAQGRPGGNRWGAFVYRATQFLVLWPFAAVPVAAVGQVFWPSIVWTGLPFLNHLLAPTLCVALLGSSTETAALRPRMDLGRDAVCMKKRIEVEYIHLSQMDEASSSCL